jgi:hypothetical protein
MRVRAGVGCGAGPASPAVRAPVTRVEMLHLCHFILHRPLTLPSPRGERGRVTLCAVTEYRGSPLPSGRGQGEGAARRAFLRQQEQLRAGTTFRLGENPQTFFQAVSIPYAISAFFFGLRFPRAPNLIHSSYRDLWGNRDVQPEHREGAGAWWRALRRAVGPSPYARVLRRPVPVWTRAGWREIRRR